MSTLEKDVPVDVADLPVWAHLARTLPRTSAAARALVQAWYAAPNPVAPDDPDEYDWRAAAGDALADFLWIVCDHDVGRGELAAFGAALADEGHRR